MKYKKLQFLFLVFLLALSLIYVRTVQATPVYVENYSFEDNPVPDSAYSYAINGWDIQSFLNAGTLNPTGNTAPHEKNVAFLNGTTIGQYLGIPGDWEVPEFGYRYTLTLRLGTRADITLQPDLTYGIQFIQDTDTDDTNDTNSGFNVLQECTDIDAPNPGTWEMVSFVYEPMDSVLSTRLGIKILSSGFQINVDKVSIEKQLTSASVPEPITLLLLGTGLIGLGIFRRRF